LWCYNYSLSPEEREKEEEGEEDDSMDNMDEEDREERRRRRLQRVSNFCRTLAAFAFSHIGLAAMVVAYAIMGGFLFQALEVSKEFCNKNMDCGLFKPYIGLFETTTINMGCDLFKQRPLSTVSDLLLFLIYFCF